MAEGLGVLEQPFTLQMREHDLDVMPDEPGAIAPRNAFGGYKFPSREKALDEVNGRAG